VGGAKEIHVRVAGPPIIAPCFYGIDMSTIDQLIAPKYFSTDGLLTDEAQQRLADDLGADSLRYLPVDSIARAVGKPPEHLCRACVTGDYPTKCGQSLYQIALDNRGSKLDSKRTYEQLAAAMGVS
jgi:amidophosphoribosyltransferase